MLPPGSETQCTGPAPLWALHRSLPPVTLALAGGSGILKPIRGLLRAAAMGFCSQGLAPTCLRGGQDTGPPRDCPAVLVTEARHAGSMLDSGCPHMCQGQLVLRLLLWPLATLGSLHAVPAASLKLLSSQGPRLTKQMAPKSHRRVSGLCLGRVCGPLFHEAQWGRNLKLSFKEGGRVVRGLRFLPGGAGPGALT